MQISLPKAAIERNMKKIRVWDLPVRLFHWSLVVLVVLAVITQKIGGSAMEWHFRCGYAVLTLVMFRIIWGFAGPQQARFSSFIFGPAKIVGYLRQMKIGSNSKPHQRFAGHNPIGGLAVVGFLVILLMQTISGLFSNDANDRQGPLAKFISNQTSDLFTDFHKDVSTVLLYIFIGLHVAAIAYYYFRKNDDLVSPMITGDKVGEFGVAPANDSAAMRLLGLLIILACGLGVYLVVSLTP